VASVAKPTIADKPHAVSRNLHRLGESQVAGGDVFSFLAFPDSHIFFVKPEVTKLAAKVCRKDIRYVPEVNWTTYAEVLRLAEDIKTRLIQRGQENLIPKDMIDVQSLIWVIGAYDD
jgi:hypothetical protein